MPPEERTTTAPPPPPASGRRARWRVAEHTRASCTTVVANTLCTLLLVLLLVAGVVLFVVWLSLRPHRPRFAVVSFTVVSPPATGGGGHQKVAFNVSDRNPNRHIGIHYDATRAAVLYGGDDVGAAAVLVATGPAFADGWYQPNKTTTFIAGVLDVVGLRPAADAAWPAFAAGLARAPAAAAAAHHGHPVPAHHRLRRRRVPVRPPEDARRLPHRRRLRRQPAAGVRRRRLREILLVMMIKHSINGQNMISS